MFRNLIDRVSLKNQESIVVLINIVVLVALFMLHVVFYFEVGAPSTLLIVLVTARFILLIFELFWLQSLQETIDDKKIAVYANISIWFNVAFGFAASVISEIPDSHYTVLMVLPVVASAYRFNLGKTMIVCAMVAFFTIIEVLLGTHHGNPISTGELFEATTVSLIFFVVGGMTWMLVNNLRENEQRLLASMQELNSMQKKLLMQERLSTIGMLSSAIAHEIRNPVAMISSSLSMAKRTTQTEETRRDLLSIAADEAKRLENLTTDFLMFAREKALEVSEIDVREFLGYLGSLAQVKGREAGVSVKTACEGEITGTFDRTQMQQAALNLLLNAIEAAGETGGNVLLGCKITVGDLVFSFENNGKAIEKSIVDNLFEPFFTTRAKGTGLGLSIARKIAEAHQGKLVLAENRDKCVRFEIRIPKNLVLETQK
ncbi:MAG: sensor histidine kinase [Pyrinomonadaceae bacterium]